MNLEEAIKSAKEGNFVTNTYFGSDQSMHYYEGHLYYEDGIKVPEDFLNKQSFAKGNTWSIKIKKEDVDNNKLKEYHKMRNRYSFITEEISFEQCKK